MKYAVETINLTKIFSDWWGRNKVVAVDNLNLKVCYNEIYGLLGPNGSGKTTTLKILLGLLYPTKGKAMMLGGNGTEPKISARIGFMPEESYLYRYLNARETLDFYGRLFKLPAKVRKQRIEALLDMVGLKAVANRAVGTYSKGMARKIGLAQALINDPELLILDEPTTGLDPIGTRQIKDLILKLSKRGKTILLCSHLLADVEDVCDRISILYSGRIQKEGKVRELLGQADKRQITTGFISDDTLEKIKNLVNVESVECEITSPMDKLETFFIKTVATAQKESKVVRGAVSNSETPIAEFLSSEDDEQLRRNVILDKLVSRPVSPPAPAKSSKPEPPESSEQKPDDKVISQLTKPVDSTGPKTDILQEQKTEPSEPAEEETPTKGKTRQEILDELTGRSVSKKKDDGETDKPKKDSENA